MIINQLSGYRENMAGRLTEVLEVLGRSDDMLNIRCVNLFPPQIESILLEITGNQPNYHLIFDCINGPNTLVLQVEVDEIFFQKKISQLQDLQQNIQDSIESSLGIKAHVNPVEPKTLARNEGKSKRITDKENKCLLSHMIQFLAIL